MIPHMRLPFFHDRATAWSAHAAEIGRVGTIVSAVTAAVVVVAESFRPGVVGAVLPLETVLAALTLCIVLSLLAPAPTKERYAAVTVLFAFVAAGIAGKVAMLVFAPEGENTPVLVAATVVAAATLVAAARHPEH